MTNKNDDIEMLQEEMGELDYRLERIENFLASFGEGPAISPNIDPIIKDVAEALLSEEKISPSSLSRKMSFGYAKACRLIDQLEFLGLISSRGSRGEIREVYRDKIKAYLEEVGD